ncbi:uncharacterized protein MONBRDRAFT_28103 [Monosiga brevicollis MX1]|uniref:P-type ATPase A domain-containing protein n=1 Tax=Monosiga brevicollis TaxID=81824 RepID=A9V775_MONBE|nr:uncharacterized protein MONBRDRAFT_28103 [Monosiga brevicollis MX1]EDQ86672.1 predicted protein [Monosiga brevicollis MX1]|eukprot:XP_001748508.1 hypothetical protein [Monosiga brevicollis MX1]
MTGEAMPPTHIHPDTDWDEGGRAHEGELKRGSLRERALQSLRERELHRASQSFTASSTEPQRERERELHRASQSFTASSTEPQRERERASQSFTELHSELYRERERASQSFTELHSELYRERERASQSFTELHSELYRASERERERERASERAYMLRAEGRAKTKTAFENNKYEIKDADGYGESNLAKTTRFRGDQRRGDTHAERQSLPAELLDVEDGTSLWLRLDVLPFIFVHLMYIATILLPAHEASEFKLALLGLLGLVVAQTVTFLLGFWYPQLASRLAYMHLAPSEMHQASHALVEGDGPMGQQRLWAIEPLHRQPSSDQCTLAFRRLRYALSVNDKSVRAVRVAPDLNQPLAEFCKARGLATELVEKLQEQYGSNTFEIPIPTVRELFMEQIAAPFFVFQTLCMLLFMLDDYWYFSLFTLGMLLLVERMTVMQRHACLRELNNMRPEPFVVVAFRSCLVTSCPLVRGICRFHVASTRLPLSGCVRVRVMFNSFCTSIGTSALHAIPADGLLLAGTCVVNEAMLTGESVPQFKEPVAPTIEHGETLLLEALEQLSTSILFSGTEIIQHTNAQPHDGLPGSKHGVVVLVLRTGFDTAQGDLVRTIVASQEASVNTRDSLVFVLFLLVFALSAAGYTWWKGLQEGKDKYKLIVECLLIITSVVPPELPIQLTLAIINSVKELRNLISVTQPYRVPLAGKIDVVCFDKTGTITQENLDFDGVVLADGSVHAADELAKRTDPLAFALAACHSLVAVQGAVTGDPMEQAIVQGVGYTVRSTNKVSNGSVAIEQHQRFAFRSEKKRMGVVANVAIKRQSEQAYFFVKGAPEALAPFLQTVPAEYTALYERLARQGKRVLALAAKPLPNKLLKQQALDQADLESALEFLGFIVLTGKVKPDSRRAVADLQASSHHVVMITGDSALTAAHVALEVGIVTEAAAILQVQEEDKLVWQLPNGSLMSYPELPSLPLCVTGRAIERLAGAELGPLLPMIKVFARTTPEQKADIIRQYEALNLTTCMCGDGTNDVAALKAADVGLALLSEATAEHLARFQRAAADRRRPQPNTRETDVQAQLQDQLTKDLVVPKLGDATIAAPFTSRRSTCASVVALIKQGRATLVSSAQMMQILALNCLLNAYSLSVLAIDGVKFSDTQMTSNGLAVAMCMLSIASSKPLKTLSSTRPYSTPNNMYMLFSVLGQHVLNTAAQHGYGARDALADGPDSVSHMGSSTDVEVTEDDSEGNNDEFAPSVVNTIVYLLLLAMQASTVLVCYKGAPFMQSLKSKRPLLCLLGGMFALALCGALQVSPELNGLLELAPMPADLAQLTASVLILDVAGAFLVDRMASIVFPLPTKHAVF